MCGITGAIRSYNVVPLLIQGLERLEYRGYDSAGIAVMNPEGIQRLRSVGPLNQLKQRLSPDIQGNVGIGHTRWATHGSAHETNAHPHISHGLAVVHNGILENFDLLKRELSVLGYEFESETDTEVIAHWLHHHWAQHPDNLPLAMAQALKDMEGSFALAVISCHHPDTIIALRKGVTPLLVGFSPEGACVASDPLGCVAMARTIGYLESDTWAMVTHQGLRVYDFQGCACPEPVFSPHPFPTFQDLLGHAPAHITLLGCGTSFYAAWVGKYFLESLCPISLELASEFHYRKPHLSSGLTIVLSQSGETADTLKAAMYAKDHGQKVLSLVNAPHSAIARLSHWVIETQAGPEVAVASTKSFTAQLWILLALSGVFFTLTPEEKSLLPILMERILLLTPDIQSMAKKLSNTQSILYVGRGPGYPVALEGALKMKELAYIHAEGLAAGELKHGSLAMIDQSIPVIMLMPYDDLFAKNLSNLHELAAHNGNIWVITDEKGLPHMALAGVREVLLLPDAHRAFTPFLYTMVLQLLAYYTALQRQCAIDQPRHLAKSVTVE